MNVPQWISGCMEMEGRMAELYGILSERFTHESRMFKTLRVEEIAHMTSLTTVEVMDEQSHKSLEREAMLLFRSLQAVGTAIEKASTASMDLKEALELSLNLEESIVENFIVTLPLTGLDTETEFNMLMDETTHHAGMIRDAMRRNGFMHDN